MSSPRNDLVKNCRVHPAHWLISTQVGVPIDLCELARFDAGAAQGLLRWPEKLLPVFDEALNDGVQKLLASQTASRHPDWRERKARARLRHCPPLSAHRKPNVSALRCGDVGPLVQIEGTVVRTGAVRVLEAQRWYRCLDQRCEHVFAVKPDALPREMFKVVGRAVWWDSGSVAVGFRMLLKVFDYGFFAALISRFAHTMSDYKKNV